ncbi:death-associated protein kinase 1-like [Branchiostoma floridae x Branchiostoma japonicum]
MICISTIVFAHIHGWLSFIHCSNADPTNKPRIVLIASHADKLQDHEAGLCRTTALLEHYRKLFQESLIVSQEVFLINCLEAGSPEIQRLREVLAAFRDDILKQRPKVPKVCVRLLDEIEDWKQERKEFPVMAWQEYLASMEKATYGTVKGRIVQLASSYLHDEGEIISLCHEANSSVVLDPQWLFTSIFGPLLAPENFDKIIDKINRTAEDHVTLEELTRVFSAVADIPLLVKLLQDFQLCHTYDGRTFILPSLLQQEMEEAAWSPVSSKAVYFGLQIRCRTEIDSFSCDLFPRLQTLLMQAHPDKLSRPLLWKNSVKCTDGKAEALLQITQDKRQLNIFVRSNDGSREDCNSIMDLLKDTTYRLLHETSPGARSRDMVLSALDLREHRPQPHPYSREEVEAAAAKGENLVHPQRKVPEKVKDVLLHLGNLKGMLGRVARKRPELVETLRHINPILNHLRADDVINLDENDRIRAARTPQDAARELLDILEAKGERACVKFHSVLKTCDKFAASLIVEEEMSEEGATAS